MSNSVFVYPITAHQVYFFLCALYVHVHKKKKELIRAIRPLLISFILVHKF